MLHVTNLSLTFEDAARTRFKVLDIPRLDARPGALLVLTGSSGSGKTTLLNTLCGMQAADEGRIDWAGQEISSLSETARDRWRRDHVGLVFQDFHLIEELSPLDNVLVPAWFSRFRAGKLRQRAKGLLSDLGVPASRRRLSELSRGERQRVALARALLFDPQILLADEPTASLDRAAGAAVIETLRRLAQDEGRFIMAVSHDPALIAAADRVIELARGRLRQEVPA